MLKENHKFIYVFLFGKSNKQRGLNLECYKNEFFFVYAPQKILGYITFKLQAQNTKKNHYERIFFYFFQKKIFPHFQMTADKAVK